jgi:hypothetical protein
MEKLWKIYTYEYYFLNRTPIVQEIIELSNGTA